MKIEHVNLADQPLGFRETNVGRTLQALLAVIRHRTRQEDRDNVGLGGGAPAAGPNEANDDNNNANEDRPRRLPAPLLGRWPQFGPRTNLHLNNNFHL